MRPYLAVLGARFRMLLQYRAAALANSVVQFFWGAVRLMVLSAFYAAAVAEPPMSLAAIVAYVWLGQMFFGLLPMNLDPEIQEKFLDGTVAYELLRPTNLYWFWFARTLAFKTADTSMRAVPLFIVSVWVLPVVGLGEWALPMPEPISGLLFLCSMICTVALACAIVMLYQVCLFWLISGRGLQAFMMGITSVFSGMIIPLPLFPDWFQGFLNWQPLRGLADVPFRIYSGNIAPVDAVAEIALQGAWVLVVVACGYGLLLRAKSRLVVQGG